MILIPIFYLWLIGPLGYGTWGSDPRLDPRPISKSEHNVMVTELERAHVCMQAWGISGQGESTPTI